MRADAAQMHHTLDARPLDGLFIIFANLCNSDYDFKILVKETVGAERCHNINYIGTFGSG